MRVLVVDQDSDVLTSITRTLGEYFSIDAVTTKTDALDLVKLNEFEVIVAGERLADGSGLELLAQMAKLRPAMLRIFAAERERLGLLKGRLGPFKLFRTLGYPIQPRQLLAALSAAAGDEQTEEEIAADDALDDVEQTAPVRASAAVATPSKSRQRQRPTTPTRATPATPGRHPPVQHSSLHATASIGTRPRVARQPSAEALAAASKLAIVSREKPGLTSLIVANPSRNAFLVGAALVVALGVLFLAFRQFTLPHRPVVPTNLPAKQLSHYPPEVVRLVSDTETAFVHDDFKAARTDIAALQQIAPDHPRLPFFETLLRKQADAERSARKKRPPADAN